MQYLCLIYDDEKSRWGWTREDLAQMRKDYFAFTDDIKESGHYVGGNALQPTSAATTVRVREGKMSATDGPFVETREQLGGYYLIEAKDLNDALQVAARIPGARWGGVEVRPVLDTSKPVGAA